MLRAPARPRRPSTIPELRQPLTLVIEHLRQGLPAERVSVLASALGMSRGEVAALLGVSTATLTRRERAGRLTQTESERLLRYARLAADATLTFGSPERGRDWLRRPQVALGGDVSLEFADTEPGAQEVARALGRIRHGIPL